MQSSNTLDRVTLECTQRICFSTGLVWHARWTYRKLSSKHPLAVKDYLKRFGAGALARSWYDIEDCDDRAAKDKECTPVLLIKCFIEFACIHCFRMPSLRKQKLWMKPWKWLEGRRDHIFEISSRREGGTCSGFYGNLKLHHQVWRIVSKPRCFCHGPLINGDIE